MTTIPASTSSVLILGLGTSGLAMARWCARGGVAVRAWDSRQDPPGAAALGADVPGALLLGGALDGPAARAALDGVQRVLKSPGLAPRDERIAAVLAAAHELGIPVQGELDLFAQALSSLKAERGYAPKVLAITGTNGKTTVTALTALLVDRAGHTVAMAGNIGPAMLDTLAAALDARDDAGNPLPLPEVWVLELSSFQLDGVRGFEPSAATVLNLTQDHLDWHGDMAAYAAAKARIFGARTVWVVNRDDPRVEALVPSPPAPPAKGVRLSRQARDAAREAALTASAAAPHDVVRFGLDAPREPGDYGLVEEAGMAWLVRALPSDEPVRRVRRGAEAEATAVHLQRLMPADALRIRGRHNAANALAALALATAIGCPLAPMLHGLREYRGEPHRVEYLATIDGVEAYDDSKGTNVGATVAALNGLGADKVPARLVVVLGGDGKGQDFSPLRAPVDRFVRAVALIGRDAGVIDAALQPSEVPRVHHDTLEAATRWCFQQARPGDAVLLSPACASLDMFRNYAHRAEVFAATVQALAAEQGALL